MKFYNLYNKYFAWQRRSGVEFFIGRKHLLEEFIVVNGAYSMWSALFFDSPDFENVRNRHILHIERNRIIDDLLRYYGVDFVEAEKFMDKALKKFKKFGQLSESEKCRFAEYLSKSEELLKGDSSNALEQQEKD